MQQYSAEKLLKTIKKTQIFLTVWFAIVLVGSIVGLAFGNLAGIATLLLCIFYIFTLFQKDETMKWIGFWIHLIFSTCGGLVAVLVIIMFSLMAALYSTTPEASVDPNSAKTVNTIVVVGIVLAVVYVVLSIVANFIYYRHCKAAKQLTVRRKQQDSILVADDATVLQDINPDEIFGSDRPASTLGIEEPSLKEQYDKKRYSAQIYEA